MAKKKCVFLQKMTALQALTQRYNAQNDAKRDFDITSPKLVKLGDAHRHDHFKKRGYYGPPRLLKPKGGSVVYETKLPLVVPTLC